MGLVVSAVEGAAPLPLGSEVEEMIHDGIDLLIVQGPLDLDDRSHCFRTQHDEIPVLKHGRVRGDVVDEYVALLGHLVVALIQCVITGCDRAACGALSGTRQTLCPR